ncbi:hypothetical protein SORBI_3002G066700 [Sorghum bicolor]|uniref:Uncharacterized protein n=2 Tax=Sorghum bicolor TaxID=4558 RepID=A0A1W0W2P6_SORBI|nr:hypothetical protein SORBI_3002G066700 [Sorghum bicolor]
MRAAVACKPWCRLVCGPGFRRRFREHHGSPPLLGVVSNCMNEDGAKLARFVPTGSFRPRRAELINWLAIDSRHGRVLLRSSFSGDHFNVAVWDPITDELLELPATPWMPQIMHNYKGAVLCAADGCDHLDCHGKPFLVVFVGAASQCSKMSLSLHDPKLMMSSYVYSSEANAWSGSAHHGYLGNLLQSVRSTLVENALYFVVNKSPGILKYNLGTRKMTTIRRPPMSNAHSALMIAEGGGLGCAALTWSKICLWSAEVGLDRDIRWVLGRTIELTRPVPAGHSICGFDVAAFADGSGIVHVETNQGSFIANLKSGEFSEVRGVNGTLDIFVPYMSFYTPALQVAPIDEDPRAGESPALSSEVIKNLAPEALSDEGLPRKKKLVEAIGQSKATREDKDAKEKANKSNSKQQ